MISMFQIMQIVMQHLLVEFVPLQRNLKNKYISQKKE